MTRLRQTPCSLSPFRGEEPESHSPFSSLQSSRHDPLHEVSLRHEEDHDDRDQHRHARRHQEFVFRALQSFERGEAEREGLFFHRLRVDERAEEVVPMGDEAEERDGRERRFTERQRDVPVDAERAAAVEPCRFFEFAWARLGLDCLNS